MDKTYQEVYFYLDSQYKHGRGWLSQTAAKEFHNEIDRLFTEAGWEIREDSRSGSCDSALKGKQELYLHPMMVSGVLLPEEIPSVEEILRRARTVKLRETRTFRTYRDMDDAAYASHLASRRDEMVAAILEGYRTKRRNLYIAVSRTEQIAKPFVIPRLTSRRESGDMAEDVIAKLTEELTAQGRLVTAETRHGVGIRTATEAELKAMEDRQAVGGMDGLS